MSLFDITLELKKNGWQAVGVAMLCVIGYLIYQIGYIKMPEMQAEIQMTLWKQERGIRMMLTQEQIDRLEMELNHMQAYKSIGFTTEYQKLQYENLPKIIQEKKYIYLSLEKADYDDPLVSGARGSN